MQRTADCLLASHLCCFQFVGNIYTPRAVLDLIEQGLPTGKLEKYLCYPSLLTALEKTKSDLGGARRKSLAPAAADAAPPEAPPPKGGAGDRAESKSGKSRDGKAQNKPQTGSDKSRPDSSG